VAEEAANGPPWPGSGVTAPERERGDVLPGPSVAGEVTLTAGNTRLHGRVLRYDVP